MPFQRIQACFTANLQLNAFATASDRIDLIAIYAGAPFILIHTFNCLMSHPEVLPHIGNPRSEKPPFDTLEDGFPSLAVEIIPVDRERAWYAQYLYSRPIQPSTDFRSSVVNLACRLCDKVSSQWIKLDEPVKAKARSFLADHAFAPSENPNGIPSQSPGLRGWPVRLGPSHPGSPSAKPPQPRRSVGVAAHPFPPARLKQRC